MTTTEVFNVSEEFSDEQDSFVETVELLNESTEFDMGGGMMVHVLNSHIEFFIEL